MSSCPAISVAESSNALPAAGHAGRAPLASLAIFVAQGSGAVRLLRSVAVAVLSNVWVLLLCKAVIGCVSAFDTYLTMKYAVSLDIYEQNPLGRWLMGLDQGPVCDTQQIAAFITAKFLGTLLVLIAIQGLAFWKVRVAGLVAMPVALSQLYLVSHLVFAVG